MTSDIQNPAADAAPGLVAGEASLIATFYGERNEAPPLHKRLYRKLAGKPQATGIPDFWQDPANDTTLRLFYPPAARDTAVVQVLLNASGDAGEAWETMRRQLQDILDGTGLSERWWGYTLVHHAVLNQGIGADQAIIGLRSAAQRLGPSESLFSLEQAEVPGGKGKVWLLDTPRQGDGMAAAIVYVTLCPSGEEEEAAVARMFYGPDAKLLMPDLIAHKGYHQMRQHRGGNLESMYVTSMDSLRETTEQLLMDLGRGAVRTAKLDELARKYHPLVSIASNLKNLHVSLVRQSYNYDWWRARTQGNNIIEYHRRQLEMATLELKLKVEEIQHALETADKAVSVAQVQVDKALEKTQREAEDRQREEEKEQEGRRRTEEQEQEDRQQEREDRRRWIRTILAVVAVALALLEMIDRKAARALLGLLAPEPPGDVLVLIATQFAVVVVVAFLVGLAVYFFSDRRER